MGKSYFPEIDGLRALAVILVLLFHLKIPGFDGGFIGVDIFFVISGYLITSIYFKEVKKTGNFNFYNYFLKRIFRLFPALCFVVFLSLIVSFFIFSPIDLVRIAKTAIYSVLFISNIFFLNESNYWTQINEFKIFIHTWSLGIEMSFYILMPIFLFLIFNLNNNYRIFVILLSIIINLIIIYIFIHKGPIIESKIFYSLFYGKEVSDLLFYLIPFRFFEFLFGSLIFFVPKKKIDKKYEVFLFGIGILLIISTLFQISPNHKFQSFIVISALIGSSFIIYFKDAPRINVLFNNKISIFIGLISYSLYLVHWPIISFVKYSVVNELSLITKFNIIIFSILLSFMIYKFIEKPFRNKDFTIRNYLTPIILIVTILYSNYIKTNNGFLERLNDEQKIILSKIKSTEDPCERIYSNVYNLRYKICLSGDEENAGIIVLGDSNATTWFPASKKIADKLGMSVVNYRRICNSFPKNPISNCNEINPKAKILIIGNLWFNWQSKSEKIDSDILKYINNINDLRLNKKYEEVEKIIIFGQIPALKMQKISIMSCLLRPKYFFNSNECEKNYAYFKNKDGLLDSYREVNYYLELYGNDIIAKNFDFLFVDPLKSLCHQNDCLQYKNSELFYVNNNHLSEAGTNFVYEDNKFKILSFLIK